jgi:hypothetical protein
MATSPAENEGRHDDGYSRLDELLAALQGGAPAAAAR